MAVKWGRAEARVAVCWLQVVRNLEFVWGYVSI